MSFLDMLSGSGDVDLKKCGDVVVSPSDNMIALYCHFCRDIFTQLPEFLRHLQWAHADALHFTKEHNVYSVEELMSDEQEGQEDAQSAGDSSSSGDSGVHAESEEPVATEGYQIDPHDTKAKIEPKYKAAQQKVLPNESDFQEKESKVEARGFKGPRKKVEIKGKSLKICELKSHAIAKNSRKHMSIVKSRILQALESDLPATLQMKPPNTKYCLPISEPLQEENIPTHTFQTPPKPVPIASNLSVRKSTLTKAQVCVVKKTLNAKPKPTPTVQKVEVFSASSVDEMSETPKLANQFQVPRKRKSSPLQIRNVEILSPLNLIPTALIKPNKSKDISVLTPLNNLPKTSKAENANENSFNIKEEANKPSMKRVLGENNHQQVTNQSLLKRELNSSISQNPSKPIYKKFFKNSLKLEQETLSSFNKSLQATTAKENMPAVRQVHSSQRLFNDNAGCPVAEKNNTKDNIVVGGMQQVLKKEQTSTTKTGHLLKKTTPAAEMLNLLKGVGLPAIVDSSCKDTIELHELVNLREKAAQFSKIYSKYESIWNYRSKNPPVKNEVIASTIAALTTEVNLAMKCNLSESEIKRIVNLISVWHKDTANLQTLKPSTISDTAQRHLNLFKYLPDKFAYFCESCDDLFTFEEVFKKHLLGHQPVPFRCPICQKAFKHQGFYEKHVRTFHA
ncbi:protein teflon [Drosophila biarmipes]|uniref:protein teflon n=1 Tax=Drosophila biarmipes TaxID=125945 RepID=UPI001CDABAEE|nr:protein teflon [Drosophila biarmipes]XP_043947642.1 protein teflon [Drosophila biarmipes]